MIISIASLHANPIHSGHLSYLKAAKELAGPDGQLWVILNSDAQIKLRGDPVLLTQDERLEIIKELRCVDYVVIANDKGGDVSDTLEAVVLSKQLLDEQDSRTTTFVWCNGGDRTESNKSSRESETCKELGIREVWGVGGTNKRNSSSDIRRKILEYYGSGR